MFVNVPCDETKAVTLDTFLGNPIALSLYHSFGYGYAGDVFFRKGKFHCFEKSLVFGESRTGAD